MLFLMLFSFTTAVDLELSVTSKEEAKEEEVHLKLMDDGRSKSLSVKEAGELSAVDLGGSPKIINLDTAHTGPIVAASATTEGHSIKKPTKYVVNPPEYREAYPEVYWFDCPRHKKFITYRIFQAGKPWFEFFPKAVIIHDANQDLSTEIVLKELAYHFGESTKVPTYLAQVQGIQIRTQNVKQFFNLFQYMTGLEYLNLSYCSIKDEDLPGLDEALKNLPLQSINIRGNGSLSKDAKMKITQAPLIKS